MVGVVVLGALTLLCLAIAKITRKVKKFHDYYNEEGCPDSSIEQPHDYLRPPQPAGGDYRPSCPPPPPGDGGLADNSIIPSCPPNPYAEPRIGFALSATTNGGCGSSGAAIDQFSPTAAFRPPPPYSPPRARSNIAPTGPLQSTDNLTSPPYHENGSLPPDLPPCYSTLVQEQT